MSNNSMIDPSIVSLLEKVDNRYSLVVVSARRARQIVDGDKTYVEIESTKPVTIAVNEINQGKIKYESIKSGIK